MNAATVALEFLKFYCNKTKYTPKGVAPKEDPRDKKGPKVAQNIGTVQGQGQVKGVDNSQSYTYGT